MNVKNCLFYICIAFSIFVHYTDGETRKENSAMLDQNVTVNYQRGVASLVLLSLLKQSDMYGYQLVQVWSGKAAGC